MPNGLTIIRMEDGTPTSQHLAASITPGTLDTIPMDHFMEDINPMVDGVTGGSLAMGGVTLGGAAMAAIEADS